MDKNYDPRIAEARRLARRTAREQGTPYQSALDLVARGAGATNWAEFVKAPVDLPRPQVMFAATGDSGPDASPPMTADEKDLLLTVTVGMLATALTVVLGTGLLVASTFAARPWSTAIETVGTLCCAAGVLAVPSGMSGYLMGVRLGEIRHVMPVRWRLAMALAQGWFVVGVARHLVAG